MSEEEIQKLMEEYGVDREQAEKMQMYMEEGMSQAEAYNMLEEKPS